MIDLKKLNLGDVEVDFARVYSAIYCIINNIDGKIYLGVTVGRLSKRFRHHLWELRNDRHSNPYLQNSFNLHGESSFCFGYIEKDIIESELNDREIYYISKYMSTNRNIGYNILSGGARKTHTKETREKIRKTLIEGYANGRLKSPQLGRTHTKETKIKLSIAATGRKNGPCPEYRKLQISISNKGRKRTKEFCEAVSLRKKGKQTLGDNPNAKALKFINPKTGETKFYTNTVDAGIDFDICHSFIRDLCRAERIPVRGKLKGLIFRYI